MRTGGAPSATPASRLSLAAIALLLSACPTTEQPKGPPREARAEDPWAGIHRTAEWLFATRDFAGPRPAECKEVLSWVKGEEKCRSTLCAHGRDLAKEWGERCARMLEDDAEAVATLRADYARRAREEPSECGKEVDAMLREGCSKEDKTCEKTAERWGTRCGKAEGTPLVVRMLERSVERRLPEPKRITLDTRSCEDIEGELAEGAKCTQQFACEEAMKTVGVHRERCATDGALASAPTAAFELAIARGAGQPLRSVSVRNDGARLAAPQVPTALADGSGAALFVCDQRTVDLASYLAQRRKCEGGALLVARVTRGEGGHAVRMGSIPYPGDEALSRRLPQLLLAGEAQAREAQAVKDLGAELDRAAELAAQKPDEALRAIIKALVPRAALLVRSAPVRKAVAARDERLAPAFRQLGKDKVAASKGKLERHDRAGMHARARKRMLADVREDGVVEVGVDSPLGGLETAELLPRSSAAYDEPLKALLKRPAPFVDKQTQEMARSYGLGAIKECAAARATRVAKADALMKCVFEATPCDDARSAELGRAIDAAIAAEAKARHQLDLVMSGPGAASEDDLLRAADAGGCAVGQGPEG
jgi:hypothetical protein